METNTNTKTKANGSNFFKKLGAIWGVKIAASGRKYYSGVLNLKEVGFDKDVPIIIFQNNSQREGRQDPDLIVYLSEPREGNTAKPAEKPATKTAPAPKPEATPTPTPEEDNVL